MTVSSTWVIACRGARRWFDLDAVRSAYSENSHPRTAQSVDVQERTAKTSSDGNRATLADVNNNGAGAPPLDWHADDPQPGRINLADNYQPCRSHLDLPLDELPRKLVLSMCPWAVCRVCGVPRERMTEQTPEYRAAAARQVALTAHTQGGSNRSNPKKLEDGLTGEKRGVPSVPYAALTLGWSDCGHDSWRPGMAYDSAAGVLLYRTTEEDMTVRYIVGDTRDVTATIDDDSVDLVFTSPPFLALRSYLPAGHADKHREIGSEANPAAFIDVLLELTAEWGRVLAPHGTLAVELGDTYSGGGGWGDYPDADKTRGGRRAQLKADPQGWPLAKSLALIPQLYAVALAYGINPLTGEQSPAGRWRVRNWLAWHRPNPPVGALGDKWRPASSYITVACRGPRRWFDLDAVRVPSDITGGTTTFKRNTSSFPRNDGSDHYTVDNTANNGGAPPLDWHADGDLGVGHIILSTAPYPGSHYATFPPELPRKIIDSMCPRQVCRVCGVPRERMTGEVEYVPSATHRGGLTTVEAALNGGRLQGRRDEASLVRTAPTLSWSDCGHDNYRPGLVYDPFAGTGTTLMAAQDLGRDAVGADLDARNAELARDRIGMFLEVEELDPPVVDIVSELL